MKELLLVVGGDSFLGRGLCQHWAQHHCPVLGTTRRQARPGAHTWPLDLAATDWALPDDVSAAVLCAGITAQDACRREPEATRQINVCQTVRLVQALAARGCFVVFLSTNLVFDGTRPWRGQHEATCPQTEYGRQKAEVEAAIAAMPQPTAIVRLTKVIHRGMPLFQRWLEDLSAGRVIYPFANYYCSPISATSAIEGIARIAEQRAAGVWQISSTDDVSYAEIGGHFAQGLGRDPKAWVEPTLAAAGTLEHLPRYASLDTAETRPFLGTVPRSSLAVIDEVFFGGAKP